MELEELEKKIDDNAEKIIANMNKLHSHEEKIENNSKRIKENSYALEILRDYKKAYKRQFIIIFVILVMWFLTICYLVYILNDIGVEETTTTTKTQEIRDINTMDNSNIVNGDYHKDKLVYWGCKGYLDIEKTILKAASTFLGAFPNPIDFGNETKLFAKLMKIWEYKDKGFDLITIVVLLLKELYKNNIRT